MQYALLIYDDESQWARMSPEQSGAIQKEYAEFTAGLRERGALRGGEPLQATSTATTVRVQGGETLTMDGPFAETKEQLGGFYVVECADLDEAIEVAAKLPSARSGTVEIRPVMDPPPEYAGDG